MPPSALAISSVLALGAIAAAEPPRLERVSTAAPFPRGMAVVDGEMLVLCRGRVRGAGGVTAAIDDQAGTIYAIDPTVAEPVADAPPGSAVRDNGRLLAAPTAPPFRLWDRAAVPPESDRWTDRPYCTLRYHAPTRSLYTCAFSGIDLPQTPDDRVAFSKNRSDAILRFDLDRGRWSAVERHDASAGDAYPHHDVTAHPPPHGWLDGPDNCLPLGDWLYAVSKENSLLVRYDLRGLDRGAPESHVVIDHRVEVRGGGEQQFLGHSALACHDGRLYLGCRTTSEILSLPLDEAFLPRCPIVADVVARFDAFDATTGRSANITDMGFDDAGRLYVVSAQPARVYRFTPDHSHDPERVFDARAGRAEPWIDLARRTGNPGMKSENVLFHAGWLYVTSGDGYAYQSGADGTVYRVLVD